MAEVASNNDGIIEMMRRMRDELRLTDVAFVAEKRVFHGHQLVVAASSPYFKGKFTGHKCGKKKNRRYATHISQDVMSQLLDYLYGVPLRVERDKVREILDAAQVFGHDTVISHCFECLTKHLQPANAVGICRLAHKQGVVASVEKAVRFVRHYFVQVSLLGEFLELSCMELLALITHDELNVKDERQVYGAVARWVRAEEPNRCGLMFVLLGAVRCHLLSPLFLKRQMKTSLARKSPFCLAHLEAVLADQIRGEPPSVKQRKYDGQSQIYVAGGHDHQSADLLEVYDVHHRSWTGLTSLVRCRSWLTGAFLHGMLYVVGFNYSLDWTGAERYDPSAAVWQSLPPMSCQRMAPGVGVMDGYLYVVGGAGPDSAGLERFDPETNTWTRMAPMAVGRDGPGVAVVNGLMYAIGGLRRCSPVRDVECYDPETDEWSRVSPLKVSRFGAGVAALDECVYVAGGRFGQLSLYVVERYDTRTDTWQMVSSLRVPRFGLSLTAADGKLYAMGGCANGGLVLDTTEVYDPVTDAWEEGVRMTRGRLGHAAVFASEQFSEQSE